MRLPVAFAIALVAVLRVAAYAGGLEEALRGLGASSASKVSAAVTEIGKLEDPAALPALRALQDRRLRVDAEGRVWIEDRGVMLDALTGEPAPAPPADVRTPPLSNAIRRVLLAVIAQLELRSDDPATRLAAARELKKRVSPEVIPMMKAALERESDGRVRTLLSVALAQAQLRSPDEPERLEAVKVIAASGDLSFRPELAALLAKEADGTFTEPSEEVRNAASAALRSLEQKQFWISSVANLFYGLSLGSVILLAALGLGITFGLMGVINMAHGEMLMLGAYTTYSIQIAFQDFLPGAVDAYLVAAVPAAFAVCTAAGMALERTVIRFLYGRPLETLLATWGISLVLIQTVRLLYGAQNVEVANPSWLSGGTQVMHGVVLPYSRIAVLVFVVFVVVLLGVLLRRTRLGLMVRAVTQNRPMAACLGIATKRVNLWTFGLGSGLAGLGGVALSQLGNVGPELGQQYIVDCFMVVVIGGVGNIAGTVFAALGLGIVNKLLEPVMGAVLGKIVVLVFIILFIQRRPQGLFALKGRAVES